MFWVRFPARKPGPNAAAPLTPWAGYLFARVIPLNTLTTALKGPAEGTGASACRPLPQGKEQNMDFELSEELQMLRDMARDFAAEKIAPFADKWDEEHYF
ncbi:MAG: acyl-CoA dehydrogenase family protein, partial [Pseudomonadota bacterium]